MDIDHVGMGLIPGCSQCRVRKPVSKQIGMRSVFVEKSAIE